MENIIKSFKKCVKVSWNVKNAVLKSVRCPEILVKSVIVVICPNEVCQPYKQPRRYWPNVIDDLVVLFNVMLSLRTSSNVLLQPLSQYFQAFQSHYDQWAPCHNHYQTSKIEKMLEHVENFSKFYLIIATILNYGK